MEITNLSPIDVWFSDFEKDPLSALDNLLRGRAYMGKLNRNETPEILFRLFHTKDTGIQRALDEAMRNWFQSYWMAMPRTAASAQWAEILQNAFISVQRLKLCKSYQWLSGSCFRGRSWLRSLYQGPARDPEASLLQTLALRQQDRTLLPLWIRLCRMEEDLPLHYGAVGLLGLRKLPEEDGTPPGGLNPIVLQGIVDLADAIYHRKKTQGEHLWLLECRAIMALYPRSTQYWIDNFSPLIHQKPIGDAAKWFNKTIPGLFDKMEQQRHDKKPTGVFSRPPSKQHLEKILRLIEEQPLDSIKEELQGFLEKHRHYAYQTGVSEFLAKTFCGLGNKIFKRDINLALDLAEEAFLWEPYNPFTWTTRAKIEEYQGNYPRSMALLWEAKRRFPGNAHIRTELANLLGKDSEYKIAEIIYRQAIVDFPKDDVCRNGLAGVLLQRGKRGDAIALLEETIKVFPHNKVAKEFLQKVTHGESIPDISKVYKDDFAGEKSKPREVEVGAKPVESAPFPTKTKIDIDEPGQKKPSELKTAGGEEEAPVEDNIEEKIGMTNLYRLESRTVDNEKEREGCKEKAFSLIKDALQKTPDNVPALLENGWLLLDEAADHARDFFSDQLKRHPHVLGLHLGNLRYKGQKAITINRQEWADLFENFSGSSTVINLERTLHEMSHGNGGRVTALDDLRRQLAKNTNQLPATLRENERWAVSLVKQSLFGNINLGESLTEDSIPPIIANYKRHEHLLKGIVEQCVSAI
ncbi:MAG: hypothetical protein HW390_938 [Candidatus Brocadiaceae bacterium]|nr:hypothetical protein [Candidatus Brocadiaceae bacterium]